MHTSYERAAQVQRLRSCAAEALTADSYAKMAAAAAMLFQGLPFEFGHSKSLSELRTTVLQIVLGQARDRDIDAAEILAPVGAAQPVDTRSVGLRLLQAAVDAQFEIAALQRKARLSTGEQS